MSTCVSVDRGGGGGGGYRLVAGVQTPNYKVRRTSIIRIDKKGLSLDVVLRSRLMARLKTPGA